MTRPVMTAQQTVVAIVLGSVLWFCGAMLVRFLPAMFDGGFGSALMFAIGFASSAITVFIAERLGRPTRAQLVAMMALGTGIALVLDGLGTSFLPELLYAGVSDSTQFGLSSIAWAGGIGLLLAFVRGRLDDN